MEDERTYSAFAGETLIAFGSLATMIPKVKEKFDEGFTTPFIFDNQSGRQVDFDFRGTPAQVLARAMPAPSRTGPGRPRLGVISREVSLLPRHWDWLEEQPNGASAALRRLVEQARKHEPGKQRARLATDAASRFMTAMAGNLPGFEEAHRSLYASHRPRFESIIQNWPQDIRSHLLHMVEDAFPADTATPLASPD